MGEINFNQGTLTFYIPEGVIDYKNNKTINLINFNSKEGHIKVSKNKNNGMMVDYYYTNFGGCKLVVDAGDLDNQQKHEIIISWSTIEGVLKLNIDGTERGSCDLNMNKLELEN